MKRNWTAGGKAFLTIRIAMAAFPWSLPMTKKAKPACRRPRPAARLSLANRHVSGSEVNVRERRERIDLTVHVPKRSRVRIESETGMVEVIGDFETAEVTTNTGTIHADVPLDALKFKFLWQSSHPRFSATFELPAIKEAGLVRFSISGALGPDAKTKEAKEKAAPAPDDTAAGAPNEAANKPATTLRSRRRNRSWCS